MLLKYYDDRNKQIWIITVMLLKQSTLEDTLSITNLFAGMLITFFKGKLYIFLIHFRQFIIIKYWRKKIFISSLREGFFKNQVKLFYLKYFFGIYIQWNSRTEPNRIESNRIKNGFAEFSISMFLWVRFDRTKLEKTLKYWKNSIDIDSVRYSRKFLEFHCIKISLEKNFHAYQTFFDHQLHSRSTCTCTL